MHPSDSELIARVLTADDCPAYSELVRRHQSRVRGFLRRLTRGEHALADDLAQEAFIEAYRSLARFNGRSTFSTWVCGIAYNRFRSHRRGAGPGATDALPLDSEDAEPSPVRQVELREDLAAALARLSPEQQTALHLCYTESLSHEEAATVLGWPLGTLKTHVLRGRDALRLQLRDWTPTS